MDGDGPDGRNGTRGSLADTYVAAIQHELASIDSEATLVGVVRRPTGWFHATVDENIPALGPPEELLVETKSTADDLKLRGLCDEEAHNAAWEQVGFAKRYRTYLCESDEALAALDRLRGRLESGESLVLVCFENTAKKRCHRTILRAVLDDRS